MHHSQKWMAQMQIKMNPHSLQNNGVPLKAQPVPLMKSSGPGMIVGVTVNQPVTNGGPSIQSGSNQMGSMDAALNNSVSSIGDALNPTKNMANTKEKTPLCLINELARFNKIQPEYLLTDESGPAHKKTFTVTLKLGEHETYTALGPSIKKAQHSAAEMALKNTSFKHPPPKPPRQQGSNAYPDLACDCIGNITPTVELNALAMKRGEPAVYRHIEPPRPQYIPNLDFRGMYNQRYHYPKYQRVFYVSLKVGNREFIGEGNSRQHARHNAAAKALKVLRELPLPDHMDKPLGDEQGFISVSQIRRAPCGTFYRNQNNIPNALPQITSLGAALDPNSELKSPISLVHEIALKRNLPVNFEVIRESGPPHMRTFVTKCIVGELVTEGEGNGKKVSKKRAAEKMLEELKKLSPLPPSIQKPKPKSAVAKKKSRNLIKKANPDCGQGINPISRLIQIQQAKKEKEPVYTLIAERGLPRRREFVMQVTVGPHSCTGIGPNKKLAKRAAAEALLQMLGYSRPPPQPSRPAIKTAGMEGMEGDIKRKVTFLDPERQGTYKPESDTKLGGRQLVPGLLLMPDPSRAGGMASSSLPGYGLPGQHGLNRAPGAPLQNSDLLGSSKVSPQTTATIAKELLDKGSSPTAEAILKSGAKPVVKQSPVRPEQQLLYLADVLGFQVQFTDFPKGNKIEYLSLVSLSTTPPQVSHGAGSTIEASHDQAALTALRALAEMGLDTVSDNSVTGMDKKNLAGGDGLHVGIDDGSKLSGEKLANSVDLGGNISLVTAKDSM